MPLTGLTWAIIYVVMKTLISILSQLQKYWFLPNALHIAIIMNISYKENIIVAHKANHFCNVRTLI